MLSAIKLVPSVLNCASACWVAICPDEIKATTELVPTKMPNIARKERSLDENKFAKDSRI
jgi:hypothetical protein